MEYVQTYIVFLKDIGYEDIEKASELFENYYAECFRNWKLCYKATNRDLRFGIICASMATLKTNTYLGIEDEELFDIKRIWGLDTNEYKFVAETLVDNLEKYHLDGTGVPTREEQDREAYIRRLRSKIKSTKDIIIIFLVTILILTSILGVSSYFCNKPIDYRKVDVYVTDSELVAYRERRHGYESDGMFHQSNFYTVNYRLEVTVSYDGDEYRLQGVTREDEKYYRHADHDHETVPAFLYKGRMYATESAMKKTILCFIVRMSVLFYLAGFTTFFIMYLLIQLVLCIRLRSVSRIGADKEC